MYGLDDPKKTEHLVSLDGAKERLHLYKTDLLEEGSFDSVIEGCEGVFHTASPVILSPTDPKVNLYTVNVSQIATTGINKVFSFSFYHSFISLFIFFSIYVTSSMWFF